MKMYSVNVLMIVLLALRASDTIAQNGVVSKGKGVSKIFEYIMEKNSYPNKLKDTCSYEFANAFRLWKFPAKDRSVSSKLNMINNVLATKNYVKSPKKLNVYRLLTPASSAEIDLLRKNVRGVCKKKGSIYSLTFSEPVIDQDGNLYYYVEQFAGNLRGRGTIYILNKGVLEHEVPIWIN